MNAKSTGAGLVVTISVLFASSLGAQQRDPTAGIDPHVKAQLWPERRLDPPQQELKENVIVLRDTLAKVDGRAAVLQRQVRANNSMAVIKSSGRSINSRCVEAVRAAKAMSIYSQGLSTDDAKWGEPAVISFRNAVTALVAGMTTCAEDSGRLISAGANPEASQFASVATAARKAISDYTVSVNALLKTLRISIDPLGMEKRNRI